MLCIFWRRIGENWWKNDFSVQKFGAILLYYYYDSSDGKWIEADNWKKLQIRNNKKKDQLSRTYSSIQFAVKHVSFQIVLIEIWTNYTPITE